MKECQNGKQAGGWEERRQVRQAKWFRPKKGKTRFQTAMGTEEEYSELSGGGGMFRMVLRREGGCQGREP